MPGNNDDFTGAAEDPLLGCDGQFLSTYYFADSAYKTAAGSGAYLVSSFLRI